MPPSQRAHSASAPRLLLAAAAAVGLAVVGLTLLDTAPLVVARNGGSENNGLARAAAPLTTATQLPPLDPTPHGSPVAVGTPLARPPIAPDAIQPDNGGRLMVVARPAPPGGGDETVAAFTRDGRWLLSNAGQTLVRSAADGGLDEVVQDDTSGLFFTPDGRYALTVDGVGGLAYWDRQTHAVARRHVGGRSIAEIGFSGDGALLTVVRYEDHLHVFDVATGKLLVDEGLWLKDLARPAAIAPTLPRIALAEQSLKPAANAFVLELPAGAPVATLALAPGGDYELEDLTWAPDEATIVGLASTHSNILVPDSQAMYVWWAGGTPRRVSRPDTLQWRDLAWRPDGKALAIAEWRESSGRRGIVTIWNGASFADVAMEPASNIEGLSWSPDGRLLAVGRADWDTRTFETLLWDPAAKRVVGRLAESVDPHFTLDGSRLIVRDTTARGSTGAPSGTLVFYGVAPPPSAYLPVARR